MIHSCPNCKVTLASKVYDGVAFTECPQCMGVWIFEDDLRHLESENVHDLEKIDETSAPIHPVSSPSEVLACPDCGMAMQQCHFMIDGPILLHRCSACEGLWVDHGELTQMAQAIEAANRPPTREEIAAANGAIASPPPPAKQVPPRTESSTEQLFDQEHAVTMARYQAISSVCKLLSTRVGYGFFGHDLRRPNTIEEIKRPTKHTD